MAAFESFCAGPAREGAGLYVLGDLFDQWVGDDQLQEPMAARVAAALRAVAASGVAVGIIVGNRDFLVGRRFAEAAGASLLPEQIVVDIAGVRTLLMHGDEMCTADLGYQRFRAFTHNRRWQAAFLALPYPLRRGIWAWLRGKTRAASAVKPDAILDVDSGAVEAAFRAANVTRIIHGHTHRPAHHRLVIDGRDCERYVLADWYDRGTCLEFDAVGGRARDL